MDILFKTNAQGITDVMTIGGNTMIAARLVKANRLWLLDPSPQSNRPIVEIRSKLLQRVENASCDTSASSIRGDIHAFDFRCRFVNSTQRTTTNCPPVKPRHHKSSPRYQRLIGGKRTSQSTVACTYFRAKGVNKTCRNLAVCLLSGDYKIG